MISIIAAIGKNRELGKDNKLLWHIPGELKRFREITMGHPIIMGRKTFESIGRVLPGRMNIIITRDKEKFLQSAKSLAQSEDLIVVGSLEEAIKASMQYKVSSIQNKKILNTEYSIPNTDEHEVFIIGGGQIFEQAMPLADRLYLTIVDKTYDADTFFPDYSAFTKEIEREVGESNGIKYIYLTLEK